MNKFKIGDMVSTKDVYSFDPAEGKIIDILGNRYYVNIVKSRKTFYEPAISNRWPYGENSLTKAEEDWDE